MIITSQAVDIPVRLNGLVSPNTEVFEKLMSAPSRLTLLTSVNPGAVLGHSVAVLELGIRQ